MQDRKKIIARVRALLAKTEDAGATEAEALAAAQKAAEMMTTYDIERSEIDFVEDQYGELRKEFRSSSESKFVHPLARWGLGSAIGRLTGTKYYFNPSMGVIYFFGAYQDCVVAYYTFEMIKNVADLEVRKYLEGDDRPSNVHGRTLKVSWLRGFSQRVVERIIKMAKVKEATMVKASSTGTDLMVIKNQLVKEKFEQTGTKLSSYSEQVDNHNHAAAMDGAHVGDTVNLSEGIEGNSTQQIGN